MNSTSTRPTAELIPHPAGWDDTDPDPVACAVLPAYPAGRLDLWAVEGPDLEADPEAIERATCLRYYGNGELAQAIRDADKAAPIDADRRGKAELRVCDERGLVWHRARGRAVA